MPTSVSGPRSTMRWWIPVCAPVTSSSTGPPRSFRFSRSHPRGDCRILAKDLSFSFVLALILPSRPRSWILELRAHRVQQHPAIHHRNMSMAWHGMASKNPAAKPTICSRSHPHTQGEEVMEGGGMGWGSCQSQITDGQSLACTRFMLQAGTRRGRETAAL